MADNVVFVGSKPTTNYVVAVVTILSKNDTVIIKGRGKMISKVVDIAEITRNKYILAQIKEVSIGSNDYHNKEGKPIKVSTIEITLTTTENGKH